MLTLDRWRYLVLYLQHSHIPRIKPRGGSNSPGSYYKLTGGRRGLTEDRLSGAESNAAASLPLPSCHGQSHHIMGHEWQNGSVGIDTHCSQQTAYNIYNPSKRYGKLAGRTVRSATTGSWEVAKFRTFSSALNTTPLVLYCIFIIIQSPATHNTNVTQKQTKTLWLIYPHSFFIFCGICWASSIYLLYYLYEMV